MILKGGDLGTSPAVLSFSSLSLTSRWLKLGGGIQGREHISPLFMLCFRQCLHRWLTSRACRGLRTAEAGDRLDASCVVAVTGQELGQKLSRAFSKWNRTVTPLGQVLSVIFPWEDFLDLGWCPFLS